LTIFLKRSAAMPYSYTAPAVMFCFRYDLWAIAKAYVKEPMQDALFIGPSAFGDHTTAYQVSIQKSYTHFLYMTELLVSKIKGQTPLFTGRLSSGIKPIIPVPDFPLRRFSGTTERSWLVYAVIGTSPSGEEVRSYWTYYWNMTDYAYLTNVIHTKNVPYGKPVEVGSIAHVAPAQNLQRWSLGHPVSGWNEWTLQREIASDGTPPKSMFYNGMIQFELSMETTNMMGYLPPELCYRD